MNYELDGLSAGWIREKFEDMRDDFKNLMNKSNDLKQFPIERDDYYEEICQIEVYYTHDNIYVVRAVEYENDMYFEIIEADNFDELREVLELDTPDVDNEIFKMSIYYKNN